MDETQDDFQLTVKVEPVAAVFYEQNTQQPAPADDSFDYEQTVVAPKKINPDDWQPDNLVVIGGVTFDYTGVGFSFVREFISAVGGIEGFIDAYQPQGVVSWSKAGDGTWYWSDGG